MTTEFQTSVPPPIRPALRGRLTRWLKRAGILFATLLGGVLVAMVLLRFFDPPKTPVMLFDRLFGQSVDHRPVPLSRVSANVIRAVITSEDGRFCQHWGVDLDELKDAIEDARTGRPRGASTITMQVVKNVFLWPQRSYVRKALELPLAYVLDLIVPKRRILEIYLNIAEWGPGIYGVEAAAWNAFGKSAARLDEAEAALLAVSLPNPAGRDAGDPSRSMERLARRLQQRMATRPDLDCLGLKDSR